jgi:hypothetical protein
MDATCGKKRPAASRTPLSATRHPTRPGPVIRRLIASCSAQVCRFHDEPPYARRLTFQLVLLSVSLRFVISDFLQKRGAHSYVLDLLAFTMEE